MAGNLGLSLRSQIRTLIIFIVSIVPSPHGPIRFRLIVHLLPQLVVRITCTFPRLVDLTEKDTALHPARLTRSSTHHQTTSYWDHVEDPQVESRTLALGLMVMGMRNGGVDGTGRRRSDSRWGMLVGMSSPCLARATPTRMWMSLTYEDHLPQHLVAAGLVGKVKNFSRNGSTRT
jgi:hypothetical protein